MCRNRVEVDDDDPLVYLLNEVLSAANLVFSLYRQTNNVNQKKKTEQKQNRWKTELWGEDDLCGEVEGKVRLRERLTEYSDGEGFVLSTEDEE